MNPTRCGFVTVVGLPNAGKSTFVNAVVGTKVSIVSRKPQTTRGPLRGIAIFQDTQIVFVDTPGIFQGKRNFDRAMSQSALKATDDTDCVMLIIDVGHYVRHPDAYEGLFGKVKKKSVHMILVLNKVDQFPHKEDLLPITQTIQAQLETKAIFMVSALKKKYLEAVMVYLSNQMPEGPWLYPEDQASDQSERFLCAEITRQHLMDRLGDELPFHLHVIPISWEEMQNGDVRIAQKVMVSRESHKKMIIGAKASRIKEVSIYARQEMSRRLGHAVHLFLEVKVDPKWAEDPRSFAAFGLDIPS